MPTLVLILALLEALLGGRPMTPLELMAHRNVVVEAEDGRCSGIILTTGIVLTAFHALRAGSVVRVDGKDAEVFIIRPDLDLAVLTVETEILPAVTFGVTVGVTTPVIQVGNPLQFTGVISKGYIVFYDAKYLFADTLAIKGFSGGGLYDHNGALLGMVQAMAGHEGSGSWIICALKSEEIIKALEK